MMRLAASHELMSVRVSRSADNACMALIPLVGSTQHWQNITESTRSGN